MDLITELDISVLQTSGDVSVRVVLCLLVEVALYPICM